MLFILYLKGFAEDLRVLLGHSPTISVSKEVKQSKSIQMKVGQFLKAFFGLFFGLIFFALLVGSYLTGNNDFSELMMSNLLWVAIASVLITLFVGYRDKQQQA